MRAQTLDSTRCSTVSTSEHHCVHQRAAGVTSCVRQLGRKKARLYYSHAPLIVRIAAGDPVSSPLPSVATGMAGPSMGCQDKDEGEARKEGEEKESERERAFTAPVRGEPPPKRGEAGVDPPLLFCPRGFAPFPFPPPPPLCFPPPPLTCSHLPSNPTV